VLVYGDAADRARPRALLEQLRGRVDERGCDTWGLVEGGRLVQGLLDAEKADLGEDECTPLSDACSGLLVALARRDPVSSRRGLDHVLELPLPDEVCLNVPEGYAFYAVYPELYAAAARQLTGPVRTIGIRSIGTSLAASVAAAAGGPPPLLLRPVGDPFRRELRLGPRFRKRLAPEATWAVVDEGPGLSGSSFLCVARELMARGVPRGRIHLFPSHGGNPGPEARSEDQALWDRFQRHWRPFEDLWEELPRWCEDLTGAPLAPPEDLSGGRWRAFRDVRAPSNIQQERRKVLIRTGRGTFLLKFAGLGAAGDAVFQRARALSDAGFSPPALGLGNGFLVYRWMDARLPGPGVALLDRVAEYVAFRSRALPAARGAGASPERLLEMARRNAALALGDAAAEATGRFRPHLGALSREVVRVETDNRMHRWEWLQVSGGGILKADSADHCRTHDLVGCQDAAWDLSGAAVELDLEPAALLRRFHAHGGKGAAPEVLAFSRMCYLAFQLGSCTLAADALGAAPAESAPLRAAAERYRALLAQELRK
jgi:hypothetical protein